MTMATMDDYSAVHGDADINRAMNRFAQRTIPKNGVTQRGLHGIPLIIGNVGSGIIPSNSMGVLPIVKPCRMMEWTMDAPVAGSVVLTVDYAPWAIPRAWASITTDATTLPALSGAAVAGSANLHGWTLLLDRKGALRVTITSSSVEQLTIVFYVMERGR